MRSFFCLCVLLWSSLVCADTSMWSVSKQGHTLYLGGTVHVLSASDYPLPEQFDRAYRKADSLVFETDIDVVSGMAFQQQMMAAMIYRDGRTLRTELKPETFSVLSQYCASVDLPIENILPFKPAMATLIMTFYELNRLGMAESGVDAHYHQRAKRDGKPLGQLETAQQQLEFITSMGLGQEDELILSTVRDMQELPVMMAQLKTAWRRGDRRQLIELGIAPMRDEFPALYDSLLLDRNRAWLPQIEAMMASPQTELVLVGALHLVGEDGLLQQLAQRGYTIQAL